MVLAAASLLATVVLGPDMVGVGLLSALAKLCEEILRQASTLAGDSIIPHRELVGYLNMYAVVVILRVDKHRQASLLVYLEIQ